MIYERFNDDLERVNKAIHVGTEGLQANQPYDYELMSLLWTRDPNIFPLNFMEQYFDGPSMDIFYRNLSDILKSGGHWLFPAPDPGTYCSYDEDRPVTEAEFRVSRRISICLAYDTSNASPDDIAFLGAERNWMLDETVPSLTAKRFMYVYSTMGQYMKEMGFESTMKEARFECFVTIFKMLKEKYHKKK